MVKVEDITEKMTREKQRAVDIKSLAKEYFSNCLIEISPSWISVGGTIGIIYFKDDFMYLRKKEYETQARQFAEAYENQFMSISQPTKKNNLLSRIFGSKPFPQKEFRLIFDYASTEE